MYVMKQCITILVPHATCFIHLVFKKLPTTPLFFSIFLPHNKLSMEKSTHKSYYCYIIGNEQDRTYNGYTVDLNKRLRQHNGIIKGGAKATSNRGPWSFLLVMTSPCWDCISTAMQHEWSIKYPTRRRPRPKEYNGRLGRLTSLTHVFDHMKELNCENVICYVNTDYIEFMNEITRKYDFVSIQYLEELKLKNLS